MRVKCWIPIDKHMKTIAHLINYIISKVLINNHNPTINLYLDGFQLLPSSQINDVLRENELITYLLSMCAFFIILLIN